MKEANEGLDSFAFYLNYFCETYGWPLVKNNNNVVSVTEHTLYQLKTLQNQSNLLRSVRDKEKAILLRYSNPQGLDSKDFTKYYESI